jgi:UDP-glucuronate 4-epimerase
MNILVTGGAGFIGSHLVKRLLLEGHTIVAVDNMNDYYDPALKRARLAEFENDITFYKEDIADSGAMKNIFEKHSFDAICHLAAQAGVRYSLSHPLVYGHSNYMGTLTLLETARHNNVKNFVFASSSSVYGETGRVPFTEDDACDAPVSIYAASKRAGELLCSSYAGLFDMNITALRFFTVYGPWGRPDMALFSFTDNILNGKPIELYNGGDMRRDFTYIDDIIEGFVLALGKNQNGFTTYNLGRGKPAHLTEFLTTLEKTLGMKADIIKKPMQPGDVHETYASIDKAKRELGFEPKVLIDVGIPKFVEWYRGYTKSS